MSQFLYLYRMADAARQEAMGTPERAQQNMHGNDERLPLASLEFGTKLVYGAIARVAR